MERQRYHFFHVFRSSSLTTASLLRLAGAMLNRRCFPENTCYGVTPSDMSEPRHLTPDRSACRFVRE